MAQTAQDMTGVLHLNTVTPVIQALFKPFELDASYPRKGEAYIANIAKSSSIDWSEIEKNLTDLAKNLEVKMVIGEDHEEPTFEDLLDSFAHHFGATENGDLFNLIEGMRFQGESDLQSLFIIAKAFDDGHGLVGIKTESGWYCDKPNLFEFGGFGQYIGTHSLIAFSSSDATTLGQEIDESLRANDLARASEMIARHFTRILDGINDDDKRAAIAALVAQKILQD